MKKLSVLACAALVSTLVFGSMAFAWHWNWWDDFHGTYEMVASGICNHSTDGWLDKTGALNGPNPPWTPVAGSKIWAANATIQATVNFKRNGKGSLKGINYISLLPGGQPVDGIKDFQVSQGPVETDFTYEITNDGEITITTTGGTIMNGMITRDWNVINLVNANQILNLTGTPYKSYAIQNLVRILVRTSD